MKLLFRPPLNLIKSQWQTEISWVLPNSAVLHLKDLENKTRLEITSKFGPHLKSVEGLFKGYDISYSSYLPNSTRKSIENIFSPKTPNIDFTFSIKPYEIVFNQIKLNHLFHKKKEIKIKIDTVLYKKNEGLKIQSFSIYSSGNSIWGSLNLNEEKKNVKGHISYSIDQSIAEHLNNEFTLTGKALILNYSIPLKQGVLKLKNELKAPAYLQDDPINTKGEISIKDKSIDFALVNEFRNLFIHSTGYHKINEEKTQIKNRITGFYENDSLFGNKVGISDLEGTLSVIKKNNYRVAFEASASKAIFNTYSIDSLKIEGDSLDLHDFKKGRFTINFKSLRDTIDEIIPALKANFNFISKKKIIFSPLELSIYKKARFTASGYFDFMNSPYHFSMDSSLLIYKNTPFSFITRKDILIEPDGNILLKDLILLMQKDSIFISGDYQSQTNISNISIETKDLNTDNLLYSLAPETKNYYGFRSGTLNLKGNIKTDSSLNMKGFIKASLVNSHYEGYLLDSLTFSILLRNDSLFLNSLLINNADFGFQGKGYFLPFHKQKEFYASIQGKGDIPGQITEYIDSLYLVDGSFKMDLTLSGNKEKYSSQGNMSLDSTELYFNFLNHPLVVTEGEAKFSNDTLYIKKLSGKTEIRKKNSLFFWQKPDSQYYEGKGWLNPLSGKYQFEIKTRDLFLDYLPLKTNCFVSSELNLSTKRDLPYLQGDIHIDELNINEELENLISDPTPEESVYVYYRLDLSFPRNIWIKNKTINAEAGGNLTLWQENQEVSNLTGTLKIKRGDIYLYGYTFHIDNGEVYFNNPKDLNPEIDIEASTRIRDLTIRLQLTGKSDKPKIYLSSSPVQLTQDEIIRYFFEPFMGSLSGEKEANSSVNREAENVLTGMLSQKISQSGVRQLGFDSFQISQNSEENNYNNMLERLKTSHVTLGKYITSNLFVSYTGEISLTGDKSVSIEYIINNKISLKGEKKTDGNYKMGLQLKLEH